MNSSNGPQGERGLIGATGMTGQAGEDGMDGLQGPRGFNGSDGTDGLPGPRGFNGTDGMQGPPGPNQLNSSKLYIINGPTLVADPLPPPDLLTSNANCSDGDVVVSGGFSVQGPLFDTFSRIGSLSTEPLPTFDGWSSTILATSGASISTKALCFDN